jgi:hypothetical protein
MEAYSAFSKIQDSANNGTINFAMYDYYPNTARGAAPVTHSDVTQIVGSAQGAIAVYANDKWGGADAYRSGQIVIPLCSGIFFVLGRISDGTSVRLVFSVDDVSGRVTLMDSLRDET